MLTVFLMTNYNTTWCYGDQIIFNNKQFNFVVLVTAISGLFSLIIAHQPDTFERWKVRGHKSLCNLEIAVEFVMCLHKCHQYNLVYKVNFLLVKFHNKWHCFSNCIVFYCFGQYWKTRICNVLITDSLNKVKN